MTNDVLDTLSKLVDQINEQTTAGDIAQTDENLNVNGIFQQTEMPSLGREIFSVIPMGGPTAALFNIKTDGDKFELLRKEVAEFTPESINTGLTREAAQDMVSQYKMGNEVVGKLLRGLANTQENTKTLEFLESESKSYDDLELSDSSNAEVNLFEITQRVHELILTMNNKTFRTYDAFAVVPATALGGVMALTEYVGGEDDKYSDLLVAKVGRTKFFLNPDPTSSVCYVGLCDQRDPSKSSAVFSPYVSEVVQTTDYDTGEDSYHIFNRFAITASPLHVTDNEMLYKFTVVK